MIDRALVGHVGASVALVALTVWVSLAPRSAVAQTGDDLFDASVVHEVRLFMNTRDLAELRARFEENTHYPADLVWRGERVRNVAVRSRGLGSRNPIKLGLAVDFDYYTTGQRFLGLRGLVFDNLWQDPAMIREFLAMGLFNRMGQPAPRESFARLYINHAYQGVYAMVEDLDEEFLARTVGGRNGVLFEFKWLYPFFGDDLGDDLAAYKPIFEPRTRLHDPDASLWGPVRDLWQSVNDEDSVTWRPSVSRFVDLEQFVTQAAIENYLAENDGLLGYAGMDNFYLYRGEGATIHRFFPWDKDNAFLRADLPITHGIDSNRLMRRALEYEDLRARYFAVLAACAQMDLEEAWLATRLETAAALIVDFTHADPLKPFLNADFDRALDFMRAFARERATYVLDAVARQH